jgi:hypothetical protein
MKKYGLLVILAVVMVVLAMSEFVFASPMETLWI